MTTCISGITDAKDSVRKRLCHEAAFASVQALCLSVFSVPQEFSVRKKEAIVDCMDIFRLWFQKIFLSQPQVWMNSRQNTFGKALPLPHSFLPTTGRKQCPHLHIPFPSHIAPFSKTVWSLASAAGIVCRMISLWCLPEYLSRCTSM